MLRVVFICITPAKAIFFLFFSDEEYSFPKQDEHKQASIGSPWKNAEPLL